MSFTEILDGATLPYFKSDNSCIARLDSLRGQNPLKKKSGTFLDLKEKGFNS